MSDYNPSDFAKLGRPSCSCWGKSEIEWMAHAYVQALANDGDQWKELSKQQVIELVADDQDHGPARSLLSCDYYDHWFEAVKHRITHSDGAFSVGGFWNKHRMEQQGIRASGGE